MQRKGLAASCAIRQSQTLADEFPVSCGRLHRHINSSSCRFDQALQQQQLTVKAAKPASGVASGDKTAAAQSAAEVTVASSGQAPRQAGQTLGRAGQAGGQAGQARGQTGRQTARQAGQTPGQTAGLAPGQTAGQARQTAGQTGQIAGQARQSPGQTAGQAGLGIRKRDPFANAQPITAGVGLDLIRRMGWREGQGLGRQGEGRTEPVAVAVRTGRAGLASHGEKSRNGARPRLPPPPQQHHPLHHHHQKHSINRASADFMHRLSRLSVAYMGNWPLYRLVREVGPPGAKMYLYSVTAMHYTYQSGQFRPSRQLAKAAAAELALRHLDPYGAEHSARVAEQQQQQQCPAPPRRGRRRPKHR